MRRLRKEGRPAPMLHRSKWDEGIYCGCFLDFSSARFILNAHDERIATPPRPGNRTHGNPGRGRHGREDFFRAGRVLLIPGVASWRRARNHRGAVPLPVDRAPVPACGGGVRVAGASCAVSRQAWHLAVRLGQYPVLRRARAPGRDDLFNCRSCYLRRRSAP